MHVSYQFYEQPLHESAGREHGSDVFWEDVNVVLLGTLDRSGLAEYLQGPHFQIEVHDRDRKIEPKKPKPSLFGENPEDEMINNVSLVAGMIIGVFTKWKTPFFFRKAYRYNRNSRNTTGETEVKSVEKRMTTNENLLLKEKSVAIYNNHSA